MQLLKQELLKFIEINEKTYTKGELSDYMDGVKECIIRIDEHLPKEQEAIEQGFISGQMSIDKMDSGASFATKSSTEYFNQTYKDNG